MENSSEHFAPQEQTSSSETLLDERDESVSTPQEQAPSPGINSGNLVVALVAAFALGVGLGFFGRPAIINETPSVVVETVVVHDKAVAQAPASATESTDNSDPPPATETTSESGASVAESGASAAEPSSPVQSSDSEPAEQPAAAAPTPTIMEFVMSDARHWQGDDAAPITIVEFSDFK